MTFLYFYFFPSLKIRTNYEGKIGDRKKAARFPDFRKIFPHQRLKKLVPKGKRTFKRQSLFFPPRFPAKTPIPPRLSLLKSNCFRLNSQLLLLYKALSLLRAPFLYSSEFSPSFFSSFLPRMSKEASLASSSMIPRCTVS